MFCLFLDRRTNLVPRKTPKPIRIKAPTAAPTPIPIFVPVLSPVSELFAISLAEGVAVAGVLAREELDVEAEVVTADEEVEETDEEVLLEDEELEEEVTFDSMTNARLES